MKPNTICKYSKCKKHYYSCGYCIATENWKAMACCREHYKLYIEEVLAARAKGETIDPLPDRTDMTKAEIKELKKRPIRQVKMETDAELQNYMDDFDTLNIHEAVDQINKEIDENK